MKSFMTSSLKDTSGLLFLINIIRTFRVCSTDNCLCLKFGACYITGQWGENKRCYLYVYIYYLGIFFVFHKKMCFCRLHFLFWWSIKFPQLNTVLINQKPELLVIRNCQWNCMFIVSWFNFRNTRHELFPQ